MIYIRSFVFKALFIVTRPIYDVDLNNDGFRFITNKRWRGRWHAQNEAEKTVLLWTISCVFHMHCGLNLTWLKIGYLSTSK